MEHGCSAGDDKIRKAVRRVVDVWAERQLYEHGYLQALQRRLGTVSFFLLKLLFSRLSFAC